SSNSFSGPFPSSLPCNSLRSLSLSSNLFSGPIHPSLARCSFLLHLNLSSNHLSGDFSFIFSSLTRLRILDLSFNSLSGPLPVSIASLHNLKLLNLSGNQLSGRLPPSLALLPHLLSLDLAHNQFSDELPKWIPFLTALRRIDLSGNRFSATIPTNLSALQNLNFLDLSFNSLTGDIPASIADCLNLTELRLGGNALTGNIPPAIFGLGLIVLDLAGNRFNGTIPPGSAKLVNALQSLNLSGNRFVGELPLEMTKFTNLQYLNLSGNYQLHSKLPPEIGEFKNLSVLDLRSSGFYGTIPSNICGSGSLTILQLDANTFSGKIPEQIGNCSNLHLLSLSHNKLTGSIPAAMAELKKLEILNLEFNSLSGEIPQQLGSLTKLVAANISYNHLVGRLPSSGIFPSLDQSSLRGNLGICSPLVSEPCEMDEIPKPLVLDPNTINKGNGNKRGPRTDGETESQHHRILSLSAIIAIAAAFIILVGVLLVTLLNISARKRLENALDTIRSTSSRSGNKIVNFGPKSPELSNLATESLLTKATEIGRGTIGVVYRAAGPVAIRKFHPNCALQNQDDFDREVRALAKVRHPNLLAIKGYYFTPQIQLLITEFAAGGSLYSRLHGGSSPLSWPERFHIALCTARALAHLHRALRPPVIHYNVRPSNILLDANGEAKLADFGLNRLLRPRPDQPAVGQSMIGYTAPELACGSLRVSEKCDVYGFGVVLLELVTGRKAVEFREDEMVMLVDDVMTVLERGEAEECVDRRMGGFLEDEVVPMLKLGLVCASQIPSSRPTMAEVVQILEVIKAPVIERMATFNG
ncbi:probably inactive leucine-rich repeat receptor-like protein kinase At3g28040, partial [Phalaenopsis equestris]|uniref:probably inactive leucine-rich repeat receptor-like protein kinase At3g28040 n=1 Tax=Phalaenopsis equestris TaxID=78828 RepID=UPI0009E4D69B